MSVEIYSGICPEALYKVMYRYRQNVSTLMKSYSILKVVWK